MELWRPPRLRDKVEAVEMVANVKFEDEWEAQSEQMAESKITKEDKMGSSSLDLMKAQRNAPAGHGHLHAQLVSEKQFRLVKLDIRHCSNLTALTGVDTLTSLEDLSKKNCPDLLSLPYELIGLRSLKSLEVFVCGEIRSLPEYGLLSLSLKNTSILGCHPILQEQLDNMEGPEYDKFDRFVRLNKDEYTKTTIEKLKTEETPFFFTYEEKVLLSQLLATTLATDGNQTKKELMQMLEALNYTWACEQKSVMFIEALGSRKLSLATAAGNEVEMELIETLITSLSFGSTVDNCENEDDFWDPYKIGWGKQLHLRPRNWIPIRKWD
ncbi:uncharacterized protein [Typha angustifolia]|uniref:uncharacterized protein n=1 Tax=Typha angustifolia TaxID=59011 RepID=UPI003C2B483F